MSEANLATIAKIAESTLGTTPATPELTKIRLTGEDLRNNKETVQSQEIRSDRQISDLVKVHTNPEGGYEFELSYGAFDEELAGAFGSAPFSSFSEAAITVDFDHTAQTITGAASDFDDVLVGGLITIADAATAGNDGQKRVLGKSADGSVLTLAAGSLTATDSTDEVAITQSAIVNGILKPSLTLEKGLTNLAGTLFYQVYRGMVVDQMNINIESRTIVTGDVTFIGMTRGLGTSTIDDSGTYTEPPSNDVLNGTSNIGTITLDGVAATEKFKSISIAIANNLRGKDAMGTEGNFDIGTGTFTLTGTINAYFLNNDFLTDIDANTSFSLQFQVTDAAGNGYDIFLPNCKPANGDPKIEAINTDVMLEIEYQAILDGTYGITAAITKIAA